MKRLQLLLLALSAFWLAGCVSPQKAAYATLSSVAIAVDTAMNCYGQLVRDGKVGGEDQVKVQNLYAAYQSAMTVAITAAQSKSEETERTAQVASAVGSLLLNFLAELQKGNAP